MVTSVFIVIISLALDLIWYIVSREIRCQQCRVLMQCCWSVLILHSLSPWDNRFDQLRFSSKMKNSVRAILILGQVTRSGCPHIPTTYMHYAVAPVD